MTVNVVEAELAAASVAVRVTVKRPLRAYLWETACRRQLALPSPKHHVSVAVEKPSVACDEKLPVWPDLRLVGLVTVPISGADASYTAAATPVGAPLNSASPTTASPFLVERDPGVVGVLARIGDDL